MESEKNKAADFEYRELSTQTVTVKLSVFTISRDLLSWLVICQFRIRLSAQE